MTIRKLFIWYLCLLTFFLGPATAEGQKTPTSRQFRRGAPIAVQELFRGLPPKKQIALRNALRKTFGYEGGRLKRTAPENFTDRMKVLFGVVKEADVQIKLDGYTPQHNLIRRPVRRRVAHAGMRPEAAHYVGRVINSIIHRDEIIRSEKARVVRELDGRPAQGGMNSQLEQFLANDLKLTRSAEVAQSFDSNVKVKWVELPEEMTLLRLFGGKSGPRGRYFFCCLEAPANGPLSVRFAKPFSAWTDARGLATPPENSLDDLAVVRLPSRTRVLVGTVADNFADETGQYRLGGNTQIYVPRVENFPYKLYHSDGRKTYPEDIIVFMDNGRVGHFSPQAEADPARSNPAKDGR